MASPPVVVPWRWYYQLASLAIWTLVLIPLVLIRENRQPSAWTIVLALGAILLVVRWGTGFLGMEPSGAESVGLFVATLATAWAMVWLVGPWLIGRHAAIKPLGAVLAIEGVVAVAWLGNFGPVADTEVLGWAIMLNVPAGGLVASMALARWACRKQYSLGRFMLWLLVGMVVACPVLLAAAVTTMALVQESLLALFLILPALIGSVFVAGMLYVFNLPYMLLVQRVGLYRARFHAVLSLPLAPPDDLIQLEVLNEPTASEGHIPRFGPSTGRCRQF